jgi:hypothetical protein
VEPELTQNLGPVAAATGSEQSGLRRALGYGLLGLALAVALFTGFRLHRPVRAPATSGDELEPLLFWDARLVRAASGAVRRLADRF